MNVMLIIVGIVFLLSAIIGYKRGLVKIIASLLATLVCIVLVFLISPSVSKWIQEATPLKEMVKNKCIELLLPDETTEEEALQTEIPREQQISMIEGAAIPEVIQKMLLENNNNEVYTALGVQTFGEYIGAYVAKVIADILAFLITFVVVFIIVRVALGMLNILDKIPLVGGANHLVGGLFGAGIGILIIWILFIVITLLYNTSFGMACMKGISESEILTKLYDSNILMKYITKF
ncbi:MAG: CvpA family protein [Tyzzerella sp.]|nr:CvpA family protein [Tyzzerella sp.]